MRILVRADIRVESTDDTGESLAISVQFFADKTATKLKSAVLVAYSDDVNILDLYVRRMKRFIGNEQTLMEMLPICSIQIPLNEMEGAGYEEILLYTFTLSMTLLLKSGALVFKY